MSVEDQVFDEVQTVDLMDDAGRETGQRGQCADRVLVSCVAGVDNPCGIRELADDRQYRSSRCLPERPNPTA